MRDRNGKTLKAGDRVAYWGCGYTGQIFTVVGRNSGKGVGQNSNWIMVENNHDGMQAAYEGEITRA